LNNSGIIKSKGNKSVTGLNDRLLMNYELDYHSDMSQNETSRNCQNS